MPRANDQVWIIAGLATMAGSGVQLVRVLRPKPRPSDLENLRRDVVVIGDDLSRVIAAKTPGEQLTLADVGVPMTP